MLLEKDVPFMFDEKCMMAFQALKSALVSTLVIITLDWNALFELMSNASDYAIRAILGQRRNKVFNAIYITSRTLLDA